MMKYQKHSTSLRSKCLAIVVLGLLYGCAERPAPPIKRIEVEAVIERPQPTLTIKQKQIQYQRLKKFYSVPTNHPHRLPEWWLSTDPNYFCADFNFDNTINFYDYAWYFRLIELYNQPSFYFVGKK